MVSYYIDDYLAWRAIWLKKPIGRFIMTPRGKCTLAPNFVIEGPVRTNFHMKNRDIEDAEFNLIYESIDQSPEMKEKLYSSDEFLYQQYKSLNIAQLLTNGKRRQSRKNIVCNPNCCLSYWQLFDDTLTVVSRSWDIQRAGLSDLVIINNIALKLGCDKFRLISLCAHVYEDRTKVARRTNENLGL